jgi:hypothetical protein
MSSSRHTIDATTLTPDELADSVALLPLVEAWVNAVKQQAMRYAMNGNLPGYKPVRGRSQRKWKDEDKAETFFATAGYESEQLFSRSFVTVAQAEKLMGKTAFKKLEGTLVFRTEGNPVLAPMDDKRQAINAAADFEPVKTETETVNF